MQNNIHMKGTATIEELLRRIQELEDGHAHLKQQIICRNRQLSDFQISNLVSSQSRPSTIREAEAASSSFRHCQRLERGTLCGGGVDNSNGFGGATGDSGRMTSHSTVELTEARHFNILESIDLPINICNADGCVIYRNRAWEKFYGYTGAETLGKSVYELVVEPKDAMIAKDIMQKMCKEGKSWTGEFPVRNKKGEKFVMFGSNKTLFDENGKAVGIISICSDCHPYQQQINPQPTSDAPCKKDQCHPHSSLQSSIASKILDLVNATKVKWQIKKGDDHKEALFAGESSFMTKSEYISENGPRIHNSSSSKAEWMVKNGTAWLWKGNEREGFCFISGTDRFCGQWLYTDYIQQMDSMIPAKVENQHNTLGLCSSSFEKVYHIKWDDLMIKKRIGKGSCGGVYHAVWYGSDVALKLFTKQECLNDLIFSFWHEVSLMKRLRHPNILLFMGAVVSPHRLCIVTEFLRRGSLFQLLHRRNRVKLNWRQRVHMAMDIARGMNYLHHCLPPIIHCDLKSSNILVDKNWTVKIGDFGHCRLKHESNVSTKEEIGTPEWMAPEVLRDEEADEKSDVYSYGVVLWEFTTEKIPWDGLTTMQVIKTVGFMNQRLEIPKDVDPQWASLIERCICSEPESRPTFQEVLDVLKDLQKKFAVQVKASMLPLH